MKMFYKLGARTMQFMQLSSSLIFSENRGMFPSSLLAGCITETITKTCLFKYTEKLIAEKLKIFRQKIQIFFIFLLKT